MTELPADVVGAAPAQPLTINRIINKAIDKADRVESSAAKYRRRFKMLLEEARLLAFETTNIKLLLDQMEQGDNIVAVGGDAKRILKRSLIPSPACSSLAAAKKTKLDPEAEKLFRSIMSYAGYDVPLPSGNQFDKLP